MPKESFPFHHIEYLKDVYSQVEIKYNFCCLIVILKWNCQIFCSVSSLKLRVRWLGQLGMTASICDKSSPVLLTIAFAPSMQRNVNTVQKENNALRL